MVLPLELLKLWQLEVTRGSCIEIGCAVTRVDTIGIL